MATELEDKLRLLYRQIYILTILPDNMPNRRTVITATICGLAGCLSGETSSSDQTDSATPTDAPTTTQRPSTTESPTVTESPTATDTPTESPTPTPEPAAFELVEYDAPESVSVNQTTQISARVRNTGEVAGVYTAEVYVRFDASERFRPEGSIEIRVPPGEEAEVALLEYEPIYTDEALEVRLGEFESTTTVRSVSATLSFGTQYTRYDGYLVTVNNVALTKSYTTESYTGEEVEETAPDGKQWAFADVRVKNGTGGAELSPTSQDFTILSGNSQIESTFISPEPVERGDAFEGGDLQPDVVRAGWIAYEVDSQLTLNDIQVVYSGSTYEGDVSVYWQQTPQQSLVGSIWQLLR